MIKNKQRMESMESMEHINYLEEKVFPKIKVHRKPDPDKQLYGSKRTNLLRISQEKKLKALQVAMLRWGEKFTNTTEWDRINWRKDFCAILKWEKHLSSGLNHTLSRDELKLANKLYRKYLGFVK